MTLDEFFAALKTVGGTSSAVPGGTVRIKDAKGETHCPITLVCLHRTGHLYTPNEWEYAAAALGLSGEDTDYIVEAADASYGKYRKTLLDILGLS